MTEGARKWTIGPAKARIEGTMELAVFSGPWTEARVLVVEATLAYQLASAAERVLLLTDHNSSETNEAHEALDRALAAFYGERG